MLVDDNKPTFYLAGPMRGRDRYNFPEFDAVAELARGRGFTIISPAELDRQHGIDPTTDSESVERARIADPNLDQTLAQRDCNVILELQKNRGDGLILLPGWEKSTGARAEVALALWLGLTFKLAYSRPGCSDPIEEAATVDIREALFYQG